LGGMWLTWKAIRVDFTCMLLGLLFIFGYSSWRVHMLKVPSFLFFEIVLEGALVETSTLYFGV